MKISKTIKVLTALTILSLAWFLSVAMQICAHGASPRQTPPVHATSHPQVLQTYQHITITCSNLNWNLDFAPNETWSILTCTNVAETNMAEWAEVFNGTDNPVVLPQLYDQMYFKFKNNNNLTN